MAWPGWWLGPPWLVLVGPQQVQHEAQINIYNSYNFLLKMWAPRCTGLGPTGARKRAAQDPGKMNTGSKDTDAKH